MTASRRVWQRRFSPLTCAGLSVALLLTMLLCVCVGSVSISLADTASAVWNTLLGLPVPENVVKNIILNIRLPRVLCVALAGASLSLCGAAMQGLLRNPLADGSTLGVSSGAALGAAIAMSAGFTLPGSAFGGVTLSAMAFAFGSLVLILSLAYALDRSLSTASIILIGVVFTMFISSVISLIVTFSGNHTRSLTFWTLGSFSGVGYSQVKLLAAALLLCGAVLLRFRRELDAFAVGVSVSGTVSFVGLIMPHMARMLVGPGHSRLLPASLFSGAIFLLLADLAARTLFSPIELSIGVVTSLVGAVVFIVIFCRTRKGG